jgi:DNA-binding LytR/AlgR family response regulator
LKEKHKTKEMENKNDHSKSIFLKDVKGKLIEHKIAEIVLFEVNGNYANLYKIKESEQFVNINLKQLEKLPELVNFARISPQILANPDFYDCYDKAAKTCTIFKKHVFHVSRRGKIILYAKLFITRGNDFKGF